MGVINKTTEKINELLDKIEDAPDKIENGKTPVFVTGTTTTLDPGMSATAEVVLIGTDPEGNPQYKINIGVPKGLDGTGGSGGGVADSVQWANVLNKPGWVNSATKPTYTASEVGALPEGTKIPTKTSDIENDSGFLTSGGLKTINGESIVGEGDISLSGSGGISDAPKDGKTYGRNNGTWVETSQMDEAPSDGNAYARKNKGWATVLESTESALLDNYVKSDSYTAIEPTDSINSAISKLEAGLTKASDITNEVFELPSNLRNIGIKSTQADVFSALGGAEGYNNILQAIKEKKKIYLYSTGLFIYNEPVSCCCIGLAIFIHFKKNELLLNKAIDVYVKSQGTESSTYLIVVYDNGYELKESVYNITSDSSSNDISSALGGESGLKEIISAIKCGNRIVIRGSNSGYQGLQIVTELKGITYAEQDNGDLALSFAYDIYALNLTTTFVNIVYTKSSNTFMAVVSDN